MLQLNRQNRANQDSSFGRDRFVCRNLLLAHAASFPPGSRRFYLGNMAGARFGSAPESLRSGDAAVPASRSLVCVALCMAAVAGGGRIFLWRKLSVVSSRAHASWLSETVRLSRLSILGRNADRAMDTTVVRRLTIPAFFAGHHGQA